MVFFAGTQQYLLLWQSGRILVEHHRQAAKTIGLFGWVKKWNLAITRDRRESGRDLEHADRRGCCKDIAGAVRASKGNFERPNVPPTSKIPSARPNSKSSRGCARYAPAHERSMNNRKLQEFAV